MVSSRRWAMSRGNARVSCAQGFAVDRDALRVEQAGDDAVEPRCELAHHPQRDAGRVPLRVAVHAGRDRREGDRPRAELTRGILEVELNSANDNPLVDPDTGDVLHGGNFYGGHVCFALDALKIALASVADLLDRQLSLLCTPEATDGLPANLIAPEGPARAVQSGFKAMQVAASALTAEAQKLCSPASAFSRSTESHNQDKVSLGTIAARDTRRVVELVETVAAIALLACCQATELRRDDSPSRRGRALLAAVRKEVPMLREDRRQDRDIARALTLLRADRLPLGPLP